MAKVQMKRTKQLERKNPWKIVIRAQNSADLLLYGDIEDREYGNGEVTAKRFHADLAALGNIPVIHVRINSGGGDVHAAIAMYNELKRHPARKIAHVDALAASAATIVMAACDEIIMADNARIMIHNPATEYAGDAKAHRFAARRLAETEETMVRIYVDRTRLLRSDIIQMMDDETWMTAEDALRLGFCERIERGLAISAHYKNGSIVLAGVSHDLSKYKHPPKPWINKKGEKLTMKRKIKIRNEVLEGTTAIMTTCPECGHEFEVVADPVVIDDGGEMMVDLPIETAEEVEEIVARARGMRIRNQISASVTCPECGHAFDVVVEDDPIGGEIEDAIGVEEDLIEVVEELLGEELDVPEDPIEARAYLRGIRAGIKRSRGAANVTARKGTAVLAARRYDAKASGATKVRAGFAPSVDRNAARAAREKRAADMIVRHANKGKGQVKKNG